MSVKVSRAAKIREQASRLCAAMVEASPTEAFLTSWRFITGNKDNILLDMPEFLVSTMPKAAALFENANMGWERPDRFYSPYSVLGGETNLNLMSNDIKTSLQQLSLSSDYHETIKYHINIAKEKGTSFVPLHVGAEKDQPANHWTILHFAKQDDGSVTIKYFNSLRGYYWVPNEINDVINTLRSQVDCTLSFENESSHVQQDSVNCAAYSAFFAYLCNLHSREFNPSTRKNDAIFQSLVGEPIACLIAADIKSGVKSPTDAMMILAIEIPDIAKNLRLLELEAMATDPDNIQLLKHELDTISDRIDEVYNHPYYDIAEKSLLVTALLSVLIGLAAHIVILTVAGSLGAGLYTGYKACQYFSSFSGEDNTTAAPRVSFTH